MWHGHNTTHTEVITIKSYHSLAYADFIPATLLLYLHAHPASTQRNVGPGYLLNSLTPDQISWSPDAEWREWSSWGDNLYSINTLLSKEGWDADPKKVSRRVIANKILIKIIINHCYVQHLWPLALLKCQLDWWGNRCRNIDDSSSSSECI